MNILAITGPIYITIAIGFWATSKGIFNKSDGQVLGRFVLNFGLPAMLFNALASRSFQDVMHPLYLLAYGGGSWLSFMIGFCVWRYGRRRSRSQSAVVALGVSSSNSGYVGYPILLQILGPAAAIGLALTMLVENLFIIPLGLGMADSEGAAHTSFLRLIWESFKRLSQIPMMWAIVAGLLFSLSGWVLPDVLIKTVNLFAASCAGLALFINGGSLVGLKVKGLASEVMLISVGKLLIHPLSVALMLWLVGPIEHNLQISALVLSSMPMMGIYALLAQRYGHQGMSAAAQLGATVLSFGTITALLWLIL